MCKMPRDGDASGSRDPSTDRETPDEKSFVKKMKSRVSGFLPSSLTKWLGGSEEGQKVRQRDELDDDDEESFSLQPPTKRVKRPADVGREALNYNSTPIHGVRQSFERFPEPIAIPSTSRSTRSLVLPNITSNGPCNVDLHNGDKGSDSGESTSGYSSLHRIGSKEQVSDIVDKPCPASSANSSQTALNRSIFHSTMTHERTLFPDKLLTPSKPNSSLSSRRPAFNVSTFGTPNFMDRTLSTKRIVDSPFYSGRTTYGGASAYGQRLHRSPTDESGSSQKTFVQAKPVNKQLNKTPTLSKTAKRILDTLEQYTSSRDEVKKIPNPTKRLGRPEGLISKYTGANPYLARDPRVPSNKELIVPTVTDLLKMKMKERLQDSTVSVREIAAKSNSILNKEEYTLRIEDEPETSKKNVGKMKTKVSSVRQKPPETKSIETVSLPEIRLPISTLPTFGFSIPSPPKTSKEPTVTPNTSTEKFIPPVQNKPEITPNPIPTTPTETKDSKQVEYKFSKPLVIAQNLKSIKAINNFKFSEPLCTKKKQQLQDNKGGLANFKFTSVTIPAPVKKTTPKNNGESGLIGPAKELVAGSVMDILGKKSEDLMAKFKPAEGTWECNICMIRNTSEKKKCAACETPRASPSNAAMQAIQETPKPQSTGFGEQFKLKSDQWRCDTCFVENAAERTSCAACECPKVNKTTLPVKPTSSTFGSEFKMSSDKWECSSCFVRNNNSDTKCVACTTPKPGLKEETKTTVSTWECQACWVRNKIESAKCVACETVNPNAPKEGSLWQCSICSAKNSNSSSKCSACQSEKQLPDKTLNVSLGDKKMPTFTFGIKNSQEKEPGFTFGITQDNVKKPSSTTTGFVFGETKVQTATLPSFTFGNSSNPTDNQSSQSKTADETSKTFSFGMPVKREREDDATKDTKAIKPTPINGDINSKPMTTTTESKLIPFASVASSTTASIFGSKTTTVSAFGEKPSLPQDAKTTSGMSNNTSKVSGVSGSDSTSEPTKDKSINIFSNLSTTPTFNVPSFSEVPIFNNSNAPTIQAPSGGFGAPKPATTTKAGGFNFTAEANKSSGGFPFTGTPPTTTSSVNMFSSTGMQSTFGSTTVQSSSNAFNVPPMSTPAPTFGVPLGGSPGFGAANTGSVFGAAASSTPAVPSFGAPSQPAANGAFNFGASALSNTPKTGFNFGAGSSIPQAGGFNFGSNTMSQPNPTPTAAPAFNFAPPAADTKSAFTFSAPPQAAGETKQRVIRRALRRTQR